MQLLAGIGGPSGYSSNQPSRDPSDFHPEMDSSALAMVKDSYSSVEFFLLGPRYAGVH